MRIFFGRYIIYGFGGFSWVFVGDGFIRPEVCTFVISARATSINAERGNLGTDKSVPYIKRADFAVRACSVPLHVLNLERIRVNPPNPRKSAFHALKIHALYIFQHLQPISIINTAIFYIVHNVGNNKQA